MPRQWAVRWRGEALPLAGWAARAGMPASTLRSRLASGLALEVAMARPACTPALRGRRGRTASRWR